jgi:hypothetical protein
MGSIQEFVAPSEIHTVDDLIRSLAAEAEDIPLIGYPRSGASDYEIFNAKDLDASADAAVSYYMAEGIKPAVYNPLSHQHLWHVQHLTRVGSHS